jgi:hypothetical protein
VVRSQLPPENQNHNLTTSSSGWAKPKKTIPKKWKRSCLTGVFFNAFDNILPKNGKNREKANQKARKTNSGMA